MSSSPPTSDLRSPTSSSEGEVLVRVEGVSKIFCRDLKKSLLYGLQDSARDLASWGTKNKAQSTKHKARPLRAGEFLAVDNVSFELKRGECLGLIGRNGAGKTTLLKMLNGLIKLDSGRIEMRGRVGALIALGAGFNPILSGRENIYVNGSILGLTKAEIDAKIDDIIDFAEIGEFIDAPVQSYSSGMQVRLGFAVATAMEPDVLILDEVLAVGDAAFRNKCYRRIVSLRKKSSLIFVSHNMDQVARICDSSLVISNGRVISLGSIEDGVSCYERLNEGNERVNESFLSLNEPITKFEVNVHSETIECGGSLTLNIRIASQSLLQHFHMRFQFYNSSGAFAADGILVSDQQGINLTIGITEWKIVITSLPLRGGSYRMAITLVDRYGDIVVWSYKQNKVNVGKTFSGSVSDCQLSFSSWEKL